MSSPLFPSEVTAPKICDGLRETEWNMEGAAHWQCSLEQTTLHLILPVENIGIRQVIAEDGFTPSLE